MHNYASAVTVAIAGASGYAGQELLRLLARHPLTRLSAAMSSSATSAARPLPRLARVWDGALVPLDADALAEADAVFLAVPEDASAELVPALQARGVKRIFNLSGAFRLRDLDLRAKWYPHATATPDGVVYGLTEFAKDALPDARVISCPGCYPTAALLALSPLVNAGLLTGDICIDAKSGISGAGRTPTDRTHFSEVHGSVSAYGVFAHRHAAEIEQQLGTDVTFVPHLVPIDRGIFETIYARVPAGTSAAAIAGAYAEAYADAPFVRLTEGTLPEVKHVAHTNFCDIGWKLDEPTGRLVVVSCIDNLLKGAAGQAVQNFNVVFGLEETAGAAVNLTVLKLGGELIESQADRARTADAVAAMAAEARLVIVHGGGKAIDAELARRGIAPEKRDGIRVTDPATLDAVVAVLAGTANTQLVAALAARGVRAVGLTGADDALGLSERVTSMQTVSGGVVDPGLVGRPIGAPATLVADLCDAGYVPVIASIGVTAEGALLNVNADVMAAHVAAAMGATRLLVAGSTPGVLDAGGKLIDMLDAPALDAMLGDGTATAGMIAKLRACQDARRAGVADVRIVSGAGARFETGTVLG